MSSINENQMYSIDEMPIYGSLNEQCLMVEQKNDDAMMLSQSALTALDPTFVGEHLDSMQENPDVLILDMSDDIYTSIMNTDVLFSVADSHENLFSSSCNLEDSSQNSLADSCITSAPCSVLNHAENKNTSICETLFASNSESVQLSVPSTSEVVQGNPSKSNSGSTTTTRRRRRCTQLKEKLYMKTEPFSDEEMERKRLNALKAKRNRTKQKDMFQKLENENTELRNELQLSKSKIRELEKIVLSLQENQKQKNLSLCHLRDQLSTIIDE